MRIFGIAILVLAVVIVGATQARVKLPHIQIPAEAIAGVGGFPITNTMLAGWISVVVILAITLRAVGQSRDVPGRLQGFIEVVIGFFLNLCESVAGPERGRRFFPIVGSIFLFLVVSNWMGLLPGYTTIEVKEWRAPASAETVAVKKDVHLAKDDHAGKDDHGKSAGIPLLRAASSDLNTTLALGLLSVLLTQVYGLRYLKGEYVQRFFNFREGPIGFYVGVLELIGEFAKIISFTFRLFGNIFAGEVLLAVIVFLLPWVAVLPFLGLELFVGLIQAFVFAVLTLVFMTLATTSHAHHDDSHSGVHDPASGHDQAHTNRAHS